MTSVFTYLQRGSFQCYSLLLSFTPLRLYIFPISGDDADDDKDNEQCEGLCYADFTDTDFRTDADHRARCEDTKTASTPSEKLRLGSDYGVRYSELQWLTYFDSIRFHVMNPMHTFRLGSARAITKHLIAEGIWVGIFSEPTLKDKQKAGIIMFGLFL